MLLKNKVDLPEDLKNHYFDFIKLGAHLTLGVCSYSVLLYVGKLTKLQESFKQLGQLCRRILTISLLSVVCARDSISGMNILRP